VCNEFSGESKADDDLEEVHWFSVNELPEMRLDGNELIQQAYKEICL
jgi:NADH pyrophosphatase NudC (nudix superfamily)